MIDYLDKSITFLELYGIWTLLGILFIVSIVFMVISDRKKEIPKPVFITAVSLFLGLPFVLFIFLYFINLEFLGYGYATRKSTVVAKDDNIIWVQDYSIQSSGGEGSSMIYRIQGLDIEKVEKMFRKTISTSFEIKGTDQNIVWAEKNEELVGIDISSGTVRFTINEEILMKDFPELAIGVHEYHYNNETYLVDLKSKDGLSFSIDPYVKVKVNPPRISEKKDFCTVNDYTILNREGSVIVKLKSEGERLKLYGPEDSLLNKELFFLKGRIIQLDSSAQNFYTVSYKTLDKDNLLFRCISLKGELIWEANQKELNASDFFTNTPSYESSFFYKDQLIVALDGFIISLNRSDGKKKWMVRM